MYVTKRNGCASSGSRNEAVLSSLYRRVTSVASYLLDVNKHIFKLNDSRGFSKDVHSPDNESGQGSFEDDMEPSVFVPITLWNKSRPSFRVSSIRITPNGRKLLTSGPDGELSIWEVNINASEITPRIILIGHSDPVSCLECTDEFAISTSEGGEMCRWNLNDGYCSKSVKSTFVHRNIQLFKCSKLEDELLFTCGDYHEIFIIHSVVLQTVLVLHSKTDSDWISCFFVMSSLEIGNDVVSAVTKSGYIKLWIIEELTNDVTYEVQSSCLPVKNVNFIRCSLTQTQILAIGDHIWTVFDAKYLKKICSADRLSNEKFIGGDFLDSDVLIWTNNSKFYLFKLGVHGASVKMIFSTDFESSKVFQPAMCFHNSVNGKYLVQCDTSSNITFWKVEGVTSNNKPCFVSKLSNHLKNIQNNLKYLKEVTCSVVITTLDLFVFGCNDGTMVVVSALKTLLSCSETSPEDVHYKTLVGHKGRINCLIYPHEKYSYHNKSYLLSGGSDFSVCLWDISTCKLVHRFCVQSGEIIKLLIPPSECKMRVKNSVCSVANDHSVAILNLKELKCIVLASRQLFPVVTINWRPLDDFIIIECFDGTVYVWELETGHLDRILHGVTAQEVIYACKQSNHENVSNFYLREDASVGREGFRRGLFQIDEDFHRPEPVIVRGFLTSSHSENQIIAFNLGEILQRLNKTRGELISWELYHRMHSLTQATALKKEKKNVRYDSNSSCSDLAEYLVKILRNWRNGLHKQIRYGVISDSEKVSIFLNKIQTPVLNTFNTIALTTLQPDDDVSETCCELDIEKLAKLWQSKSLPIRNISRRLLTSKLQSQTVEERRCILQRWFKYLPHFESVDGTPLNKFDPELTNMKMIALVLFGVIGSDLKFKMDDPKIEERYYEETSSAILYVLQHYPKLESVATNIIGRGYSIWENHLKFERIFHFLFEMAAEYDRIFLNEILTPSADKFLNAHETLVAIAIARTESFMSCLTKEISQVRNSQKLENSLMEKSKTEMILIVTELLERTPYMMLRYLNDIVTILIFCVHASHLKQEIMSHLIPVLSKFKQVHQCLTTQRIAVGLHDGSVVIHELKTFKVHKVAAHNETVNAVMFSPDGKLLATYSYFENKLCFWHVFSSIFGHVHIKSIKTYETETVQDEQVRNHLEICQLHWTDNKSVALRLCDGNERVFHV